MTIVIIWTFTRHTSSSYPAILFEEAVDGHLGFHPNRNVDEVHRLKVEGIPSLEEGEKQSHSQTKRGPKERVRLYSSL